MQRVNISEQRDRVNVGVIVDAYSTGRFLATAFRKKGVEYLIHVQSSKSIPTFLSRTFQIDDFDLHVLAHRGIELVLQLLSHFEVGFVIAGSETGVELADALSEAIAGINWTNGTQFSAAKRDKFAMLSVFKKAGVPHADFFCSCEIKSVVRWAVERDRWPLVVKPPRAAGTFGVAFCHTASDVDEACRALLNQRDCLGQLIDRVVIQDFLRGTEYSVNTVSRRGTHFLSHIWKYQKQTRNNHPIYDYDELVDPNDHISSGLFQATQSVLDALGIKHGPAHTEVIVTVDGPQIVEIGARLEGAIDPQALLLSTGETPVEITAEALIAPSDFALRAHRPTYRRLKHARCVYFISDKSGELVSLPKLPLLTNLDSFLSLSFGIAPGELVVPTIDLLTSPGYVYLVHDDVQTIEQDYHRFRNLERSGLYELA